MMKPSMLLVLLFTISTVTSSCSQKVGSFRHILFTEEELSSLSQVIEEEITNGRIPLLYFSMDRMQPCSEIAKVLQEGTPLQAFPNITLIQLHRRFPNQDSQTAIWKKFGVREPPVFIQVDEQLNALDVTYGRSFASNQVALNKFLEVLVPEPPVAYREYLEKLYWAKTFQHKASSYPYRSSYARAVNDELFYQREYTDYYYPQIVKIASFKTLHELVNSGRHLEIKAISLRAPDGPLLTAERDSLKILSKFQQLEFLEVFGFEYFPAVIYELSALKYLDIGGINNYEHTAYLLKLDRLEFINHTNSSIKLPAGIQEMENLRHIVLAINSAVQPYEELYQIPNLETLVFRVEQPDDLAGIHRLKQLKFLSVNTVHEDIGQLTELAGLKIYPHGLRYPSTFEQLQNLEAISLSTSHGQEGLLFLTKLRKLKAIQLVKSGSVKTLPEGLAKLPDLKFLHIIQNDQPDLIPESLKETSVNILISYRN